MANPPPKPGPAAAPPAAPAKPGAPAAKPGAPGAAAKPGAPGAAAKPGAPAGVARPGVPPARPGVPPKKPFGRKNMPVSRDQLAARERGMVLGLVVGDAFGVTLRGRRTYTPQFPELADGPMVDMSGKGPFNLRVGQTTDNTQMAVALASSLAELETFNEEDVRKRYLDWLRVSFCADPYVRQVLTTTPWFQASRMVWHQSSRRACSNSSLVRSAIIGYVFAKDEEDLLRVSMEECALTHFDPRCRLAGAALARAIANALNARTVPKPAEIMLAAEAGIAIGSAKLAKMLPEAVQEIHLASDDLRLDLTLAQSPDPMLYGPDMNLLSQSSHVRVAFRLAFWELLHAPTFEAGLIDLVNRGGDSNTNGAVAGALLGAVHGDGQIPERWLEPVLSSLERQPGPLRDKYHPKQLIELLIPEDAKR